MRQVNPYQKTPCVGRCSTVYGDPICRGCKRFINEISFWNQISVTDKKAVWQRLDKLAIRIVPSFISVENTDKLSGFLQIKGIRYPEHLSHYSWALHCIENFPYPITDLNKAGLTLVRQEILNTKMLKLELQKALYALSLAEKRRHEQHGHY